MRRPLIATILPWVWSAAAFAQQMPPSTPPAPVQIDATSYRVETIIAVATLSLTAVATFVAYATFRSNRKAASMTDRNLSVRIESLFEPAAASAENLRVRLVVLNLSTLRAGIQRWYTEFGSPEVAAVVPVTGPVNGNDPFTLEPQEAKVIVLTDQPWVSAKDFGVIDTHGARWPAPAEQVEALRRVAVSLRPPP